MTETTTSNEAHAEAPGPLVLYGLYTHDGMVRFATNEHTLVDLTGNEGVTYTPDENTVVWAAPGSPDWVDRMVRVRSSQASALSTSRRRVQDLTTQVEQRDQHLEGLGEALRAEAIRLELCDDYDTFAEEWGLPKRFMDFEVTMTITVLAADEESALEIVRDGVSISSYSEGVKSGPEFEASEA